MRIKSIIITALLGIISAVTAQAAFVDEGDTVWDNTTGLMWQQATATTVDGPTTYHLFKWGGGPADDGVCATGDANAQQDALCYCENLTLGGYDDWRLPDRNALQSLVDYTQQPTIDPIFPNTNPSYYWSSTSGARYVSGQPWVFDQAVATRFDRGFTLPGTDKDGTRNVRCVRGRTFRITSQAYGPGTIVTADLEENFYGNTVAYTIAATSGDPNDILDVVVDGTLHLGQGTTAYTFPATTAGAHTIDAMFTATHTITVTNGTGCTIDPSGPQVFVVDGDDQAFSMGTNDHFQLSDVVVDVPVPGTSLGPVLSYTFTNVDADRTIETVCTEDPKYTLTVTLDGNGRVTSNPTGIDCDAEGGCTNDFYGGTVLELTAKADDGSVFSGWAGGGCSGTDPCTVTMDLAVEVTATFKKEGKEGNIFIFMPGILNGALQQ